MTALVLAATIAAAAAAEPSLADVLTRAGAYVEAFERQLSGIVAEEQYKQEVRFAKGYPLLMNASRELRSDLLLVKPAGARDWLQFRDVYEVDGRPVRDRNERLMKLFVNPVDSVYAQVAAIADESARFNIGSLMRTINTPTLPLLFLEPKNQMRFAFKQTHTGRPNAMIDEAPAPPGRFRVTTEVWVIGFDERMSNTMVRTTAMKDLPARGRFWIEPGSGRVLMSELILQNREMRGVITVNYQSEPFLGLLVPIEMRERYDRLRDRSTIDGYATYGRFRQFTVTVDEKLGPIKK